jgi:hypothetical protein
VIGTGTRGRAVGTGTRGRAVDTRPRGHARTRFSVCTASSEHSSARRTRSHAIERVHRLVVRVLGATDAVAREDAVAERALSPTLRDAGVDPQDVEGV